MHVISASRRTDIPAFHADWFMRRIRDRRVQVLAPFGGGVFEVSLDPSDVIAIVFWTKDAAPILSQLEELVQLGHCFTFLYSINNYPHFLEPNVPPLTHTMKVLEKLAKLLPPYSLRWRYDTIVMTDQLDERWHLNNFRNLCLELAPYTRECIFSFCDYYKKTIRNMKRLVPEFQEPEESRCVEIAVQLANIAESRGIKLKSCAHDFLVSDKIGKSRCIDPGVLLNVVDSQERRSAVERLKFVATRKDCGCAASKDIGAYDSCAHGCVYCYANANADLARRNLMKIDRDQLCLDPKICGRRSRIDTDAHSNE
ncbi:MAG: DUF1848 domain-containing protein [Desulfomonile tiedjei]|uniref:DUF1848 domain-containing protein n=1 Tax=Desulfomonile tiedjei TaxID=2358 RepID=A0A9D6V1S0_9BACT|nr:DUF1848 domain-containing protein [Desulfomonile tiedjei]